MTRGLARWIPGLVIGTAVLHLVFGLWRPYAWGAIVRDGVLAAVVEPGAAGRASPAAAIGFTLGGAAVVVLGLLARRSLRATGELPALIGWSLIAVGLPVCVVCFPGNGGWMLLVIGVLALVAARKPGRH
ncbi:MULTISPECIES: DUF6463 family protein [unclassified Kitasatospora]